MRKNIIASATFVMALLAATPAVAMTSVPTQEQYETVIVQDAQTCVEGECGSVEEINTEQKSELTRKAIQAEKARNAAENDKYGVAITIIAMGIVLSALIILSLLFLGFGKISSSFQKSMKRKAHGVTCEDKEDHHDELDSGEVIAAISMALAEHMGQGHDIEDTILTIRRMRKVYSPWNSKIYNMRTVPAHVRTEHSGLNKK